MKACIMVSTQAAKDFLDYYLALEGDPKFAVLLEGPWGSGKSHFVDTYFRERITETKKVDPDA